MGQHSDSGGVGRKLWGAVSCSEADVVVLLVGIEVVVVGAGDGVESLSREPLLGVEVVEELSKVTDAAAFLGRFCLRRAMMKNPNRVRF